jgi:hypothetical protein
MKPLQKVEEAVYMHHDQLPGRPIHVRVAGNHVLVMFDQIPWQFRLDDVAGAVGAFSNNDWTYFQTAWWHHHTHLLSGSAKLALLVSHILPDDLFSANRLISLGSFLGLYGTWDLEEMEQDYQRLALMPTLQGWPAEGIGELVLEGDKASPAWPGHMWRAAITQMNIENSKDKATGRGFFPLEDSARRNPNLRRVCNF